MKNEIIDGDDGFSCDETAEAHDYAQFMSYVSCTKIGYTHQEALDHISMSEEKFNELKQLYKYDSSISGIENKTV